MGTTRALEKPFLFFFAASQTTCHFSHAKTSPSLSQTTSRMGSRGKRCRTDSSSSPEWSARIRFVTPLPTRPNQPPPATKIGDPIGLFILVQSSVDPWDPINSKMPRIGSIINDQIWPKTVQKNQSFLHF